MKQSSILMKLLTIQYQTTQSLVHPSSTFISQKPCARYQGLFLLLLLGSGFKSLQKSPEASYRCMPGISPSILPKHYLDSSYFPYWIFQIFRYRDQAGQPMWTHLPRSNHRLPLWHAWDVAVPAPFSAWPQLLPGTASDRSLACGKVVICFL